MGLSLERSPLQAPCCRSFDYNSAICAGCMSPHFEPSRISAVALSVGTMERVPEGRVRSRRHRQRAAVAAAEYVGILTFGRRHRRRVKRTGGGGAGVVHVLVDALRDGRGEQRHAVVAHLDVFEWVDEATVPIRS